MDFTDFVPIDSRWQINDINDAIIIYQWLDFWHHWHTRLSPRVPLFCTYHILTSSVIYYWTDARQHGIKNQTTTAFLFQNSKSDLCPLGRTWKKPFDVICCQNEIEAISLVAMRSKRTVIGPGKSRHRQLELNGFPWNENLQRKQNWTAKSTNLKKMLEKSR